MGFQLSQIDSNLANKVDMTLCLDYSLMESHGSDISTLQTPVNKQANNLLKSDEDAQKNTTDGSLTIDDVSPSRATPSSFGWSATGDKTVDAYKVAFQFPLVIGSDSKSFDWKQVGKGFLPEPLVLNMGPGQREIDVKWSYVVTGHESVVGSNTISWNTINIARRTKAIKKFFNATLGIIPFIRFRAYDIVGEFEDQRSLNGLTFRAHGINITYSDVMITDSVGTWPLRTDISMKLSPFLRMSFDTALQNANNEKAKRQSEYDAAHAIVANSANALGVGNTSRMILPHTRTVIAHWVGPGGGAGAPMQETVPLTTSEQEHNNKVNASIGASKASVAADAAAEVAQKAVDTAFYQHIDKYTALQSDIWY